MGSFRHDDVEGNENIQINMIWKRNGNTTVINITSAEGLLQYYHARASMFFISSSFIYSSPPEVLSRYFDVNGLEISGPEIKATYVTN